MQRTGKNKAGGTLKKGGRCYFHEILEIRPIFNKKLNGKIFKSEK
jgi:hypothetical protein